MSQQSTEDPGPGTYHANRSGVSLCVLGIALRVNPGGMNELPRLS